MPVGSNKIDHAIRWIQDAKRILVITGAGISAGSGLPTYRGAGGLYNQGVTEDGLTIEDALSGETFAQSPQLTWKYLLAIESECRDKQPNIAHQKIAQLQRSKEVCVLTQNIDSFHRDAGSSNLIEIHGNLHSLVCPQCGWREAVKDFSKLTCPPACPQCKGIIRPDIILFGEMLPVQAVDHLNHELDKGFDLVITIGTTALFPYIAGPFVHAAQQGLPTIEINPDQTDLSPFAGIHLQMNAAEALQKIIPD